MRGAFRSEPKFLAIFPRLTARRFQSEPKSLAVFPSLNSRRYSVRTKIPGDIPQFKCEVCVGQNQNPWRYFPVLMRGVFPSGPKSPAVFRVLTRGVFRSGPIFLAIFTGVNARRFSVRTQVPGRFYQFECKVSVSQNRSAWRYLPI